MGKKLDNLSGKEFGIWEVLAFDHMKWNGSNHKHGMSYYRCRCKRCGKIRLKARSELLQRPSYHHYGCGVNKNANII